MHSRRLVGFALTFLLAIWPTAALAAGPIELTEGLAIRASGGGRGGGRSLVSADAIADLLARGEFTAPKAGDKLIIPGAPRGAQPPTWRAVKANKDGVFQDTLQGSAYVFFSVELPEPAVMLLEAAGDSVAIVNGQPHTGDPYSYGYLRIPVALHKGTNALLMSVARGKLRARLLPVRAEAMIDAADPTFPDLLPTDRQPLWASVVVQNTTEKELKGLELVARAAGASDGQTSVLPSIPPLSIRKVTFRIAAPATLDGDKCAFTLELQGPSGKLDSADVTLRVRQPLQTHKRTFVSRVDGSVQYYAINPAQKPSGSNALILTLHGAGVEAIGQADAYASKDWVTIVAPTNRRPYGFDWEDIGQIDALEVLDIAERTIPHDPHRVVLTGHSMGGHGTWHVGLTFPDRFAAIGPSAGWSSFSSYVGARGGGRGGAATQASAMQKLLTTASAPGDTLSLVRNSMSEDVYILHGDADDNVPVREARLMRDALSFHPNLGYHEEKGAGHWWGSKCVDWPPMFEVFDKARLPGNADVNEIEFTTADPAESGRFHWATIEQQTRALHPSSIKLARKDGRISGTTANVALLDLDLAALDGLPGTVELDGQTIELPTSTPVGNRLVLTNHAGKWSASGTLDPMQKNSRRGGPLITAFNHHMLFVYGTGGSPAAAADAFVAARQLAEAMYYRGNGSVDVIPDTAFKGTNSPDRDVILFGNSEINSAWAALLPGSPIQVGNGLMRVGQTEMAGEDLCSLFIRPRPGSETALVAGIGFTGHAGAVVIERLPLIVSGVGFPDWTVIGADSFAGGMKGVRAAGYFGNDWSLDGGETVNQ